MEWWVGIPRTILGHLAQLVHQDATIHCYHSIYSKLTPPSPHAQGFYLLILSYLLYFTSLPLRYCAQPLSKCP